MKKLLFLAIAMMVLSISTTEARSKKNSSTSQTTREYWVETLDKLAFPIYDALSRGKLKEELPIQNVQDPSLKSFADRAYRTAYLEAFGRSFSGIAPWLELGADDTKEGQLRAKYIDMVIKSIDYATNPESPDFMNFTTDSQPLVDAAYFALGLLRAETQIWDKLTPRVQQQVVDCFKSSRVIRTPTNNWLLFSGTIEAFLLKHDLGGDLMRIDYAMNQHMQRYMGDGSYGDGDEYRWDYYNSFVIQPMMAEIADIMLDKKFMTQENYNIIMNRFARYAVIQERFISPEGTFPPMGRSLAYRTGCFQALAQVALAGKLPKKLDPAQVRCALTALIHRTLDADGTFDENGFLRIGFCGDQPLVGERYINTGSLYMATLGFMPLGLPESDPFWSNADADWTSVKMYKGIDMPGDHSIKN